MGHKLIIALDGRKSVLMSVFRIVGRTYQMVEHSLLQCLALVLMLLQSMLTRHKKLSNNLSQTHFLLRNLGAKLR